MDYSGVSLSYQTWELLYDKEVSRAAGRVVTEKPQATDEVKRLVRFFLPRFSDECRLCNQLEVCAANRYDREVEQGDDGGTHRFGS